jgi:hypothetical protein
MAITMAPSRFVMDEGPAQVAVRGIGEEHVVLLPQGPVEPHAADGGLHFRDVGFRIDQDVHRVADGIDPDEHDQRHDEEHHDALHQPSDGKDQHPALAA